MIGKDKKKYREELRKLREKFNDWKRWRHNRKAYIRKRIEELEAVRDECEKNKG